MLAGNDRELSESFGFGLTPPVRAREQFQLALVVLLALTVAVTTLFATILIGSESATLAHRSIDPSFAGVLRPWVLAH